MSRSVQQSAVITRRPQFSALRFGLDAPYVPLGFAVGALVLLILGIVGWVGGGAGAGIFPILCGLFLAACATKYVHTSLWGKHIVWRELLHQIDLPPNAKALDIGCGRGAVLLQVASRLGPEGRVTGIDLWRNTDQLGNAREAANANARDAGLADRVEVRTADMRGLPFRDREFDLVVSSLAIHNISHSQERLDAANEALRVLKPGGHLLITDLAIARDYARYLLVHLDRAELSPVGWRMWWGGPWFGTWQLTGRKPKIKAM